MTTTLTTSFKPPNRRETTHSGEVLPALVERTIRQISKISTVEEGEFRVRVVLCATTLPTEMRSQVNLRRKGKMKILWTTLHKVMQTVAPARTAIHCLLHLWVMETGEFLPLDLFPRSHHHKPMMAPAAILPLRSRITMTTRIRLARNNKMTTRMMVMVKKRRRNIQNLPTSTISMKFLIATILLTTLPNRVLRAAMQPTLKRASALCCLLLFFITPKALFYECNHIKWAISTLKGQTWATCTAVIIMMSLISTCTSTTTTTAKGFTPTSASSKWVLTIKDIIKATTQTSSKIKAITLGTHTMVVGILKGLGTAEATTFHKDCISRDPTLGWDQHLNRSLATNAFLSLA
mmetsp:Transcript_16223/g.31800  ORF Transcript_16223/g.31800 Transcript_16223/m.31800 type:complete len:349 (-) Transcript_16223:414-1460(-)